MKLIFLLILSVITLLLVIFTKTREGYSKGKKGKRGENGKFGKGPYGNPIGGGLVGSKGYRYGPYILPSYPLPYYTQPSYYNYLYYPQSMSTWIPGGTYGCPLRDGCIVNNPYYYPYF